MNVTRISIIILSVLALAGCASTDKIILDNTYRPPSTTVNVYHNGNPPEHPYTIIAELSYLGPREDELKATKKFVSESKKLGGDGVIVTVQSAGIKGGGTVFQTTAWLFKGVVITSQSAPKTERNPAQ